jgi:hypothetical protein
MIIRILPILLLIIAISYQNCSQVAFDKVEPRVVLKTMNWQMDSWDEDFATSVVTMMDWVDGRQVWVMASGSYNSNSPPPVVDAKMCMSGNPPFMTTCYPLLNSNSYARRVEMEDMDNDGVKDIILVLNTSVNIYYNRGMHSDGTPNYILTQYNTGSNTNIADLDRDGKLDLVGVYGPSYVPNTTNPRLSTLAYYFSVFLDPEPNENFNLTKQRNFSVNTADALNHEYIHHVLTVNGYDFFHERTYCSPHCRITDAESADFDGDGYKDVLVATDRYTRDFIVQFNAANTDVALTFIPRSTVNRLPMRATVADVDNNGRPDILQTNFYGAPFIFYNEGNLEFTEVSPGFDTIVKSTIGFYAEDVNGDNRKDLILQTLEGSTDYKIHIALGRGNRIFTEFTEVLNSSMHDELITCYSPGVCHGAASDSNEDNWYSDIRFLDLNGDGYKDIVIGGHKKNAILLSDEN